MPDNQKSSRANDAKLLTPLLLMALLIVSGFLFFAYAGPVSAAIG
jgi:hypothetical protein